MKHKGVSNAFLVVSVVMITVIVMSFIGIKYWEGDSDKIVLKKADMQMNIYSMNNALSCARQYAEKSLDYSVYQAVYDFLKQGGWEEIPEGRTLRIGKEDYAYWFIDGKDVSPNGDFTSIEGALTDMVTRNIKKYTSLPYSFLGKYNVYFPDYYADLSVGDNYVVAEADSETNLKVSYTEKGETVHLEAKPVIERTYGFSAGDMINNGKSIGRSVSDIMGSALKGIVEKQGLKHSLVSSDDSCKEDVHIEKACINAIGIESEQVLENKIKEEMEDVLHREEGKLMENENYYVSINVSRVGIELKVTGDYTCPEGKGRLECSFDYRVNCTTMVSLEDTSGEKHPVFTGEFVEQVYPKLVFLVSEHYGNRE